MVMVLRLRPEVLKINEERATRLITNFIRDYVGSVGAKGLVMGLSGGLDSSTVAFLAARALGPDRVMALIMPEEETYDPETIRHAEMVAEELGIEVDHVDITPVLKAFYGSLPAYDPSDDMARANVKPRVRMTCLYYYANRFGYLVCGTTDKSEAMLGYYTKWGDGAADIEPIMDLFKTQVRQLARHLGVPEEIISKPPTPGLLPGQTAEGELGLSYDLLDLVLYGLERFMDPKRIAEDVGLPLDVVLAIRRRWLENEHKRRPPITIKLAYRSVGHDFRLPYALRR